MTGIALIVGLGNPGKEYSQTRHNLGADFVSTLIDNTNSTLHSENKFKGYYNHITIANHRCHVLIPTTYMNLSGQAVSAVAQFYKLNASQILIAHDEMDLPTGTVKLKLGGGDGGHNGLKNIIQQLGTKDFYRLRIGIDRPKQSSNVVDYVLNKPSQTEREHMTSAIAQAIDVIPFLLNAEPHKAMQQLHTLSE